MSFREQEEGQVDRTAQEWERKAREVAACLAPEGGAAWTVKERDGNRLKFIITSGVLSFSFGRDKEGNKVRAQCDDPFNYQDIRGVGESVRITSDPELPAARIARQIESRFLPRLRVLASAVEAERVKREEARRAHAEALEIVREACGDLFIVKPKDGDTNEARIERVCGLTSYHIMQGNIQNTSARIGFEALSIEELAVILRALRAHRDAKRGIYDDEGGRAWREALKDAA